MAAVRNDSENNGFIQHREIFDTHLTPLSKKLRSSRGPLNNADGWMMALAIPTERGVLREKEMKKGSR